MPETECRVTEKVTKLSENLGECHQEIINIEEWRREERGEPMSLYKREEGPNKTTSKNCWPLLIYSLYDPNLSISNSQ